MSPKMEETRLGRRDSSSQGEDGPKEMMRLGEEMGPGKGCDLWRRRYSRRKCVPRDGHWLG